MSVIHAVGIHVRHAVTRALATGNRSPMESTWRLLAARVHLDTRGRVSSAEITLRMEAPRAELRGGSDEIGLVNPDGQHPLMAMVPGHPGRVMDVFPVTWGRWERHGGLGPMGMDPWCPVTGLTYAQAHGYAHAVGKRLAAAEDLRSGWGCRRYPWGDAPEPTAGRHEAPRFGEIPEVGLLPPTAGGFFDLGAWIHQWTAEGALLGGIAGLSSAPDGAEPCGFRCVQDV